MEQSYQSLSNGNCQTTEELCRTNRCRVAGRGTSHDNFFTVAGSIFASPYVKFVTYAQYGSADDNKRI